MAAGEGELIHVYTDRVDALAQAASEGVGCELVLVADDHLDQGSSPPRPHGVVRHIVRQAACPQYVRGHVGALFGHATIGHVGHPAHAHRHALREAEHLDDRHVAARFKDRVDLLPHDCVQHTKRVAQVVLAIVAGEPRGTGAREVLAVGPR